MVTDSHALLHDAVLKKGNRISRDDNKNDEISPNFLFWGQWSLVHTQVDLPLVTSKEKCI